MAGQRPRSTSCVRRLNPDERVDVPTGVGFCMYIRRDCLVDVGLFDVENFRQGLWRGK
jgi:GT2 family glycosyltransferase